MLDVGYLTFCSVNSPLEVRVYVFAILYIFINILKFFFLITEELYTLLPNIIFSIKLKLLMKENSKIDLYPSRMF